MSRKHLQSLPWVLFLSFALFGCSMPIQGGLTERQANQIIVLLAKANIQATKQKNAEGREVTWSIIVSKSEAAKSIGVLQANNMPPKKERGFNEVYGKAGMIPTATEERAKYMMALSGELTKTLKSIPGVLNARIHLVIPKDKLLRRPGEKQTPPRASVSISTKTKMARNKVLRMGLIRDIKKIVSGSMERLQPKNIQVVVRASIMSSDDNAEPKSSTDGYKNVLMFRVAPDDASKLKMALGAMVLLLGVFLVLFLLFFFRSASLKNQLKASNGGY